MRGNTVAQTQWECLCSIEVLQYIIDSGTDILQLDLGMD